MKVAKVAARVMGGFVAFTVATTGVAFGVDAYQQHEDNISIAKQREAFKAAHNNEFDRNFLIIMNDMNTSDGYVTQPDDYGIANGVRKAICEGTNNDLSTTNRDDVYTTLLNKMANASVTHDGNIEYVNGLNRYSLDHVLKPAVYTTFVVGCIDTH